MFNRSNWVTTFWVPAARRALPRHRGSAGETNAHTRGCPAPGSTGLARGRTGRGLSADKGVKAPPRPAGRRPRPGGLWRKCSSRSRSARPRTSGRRIPAGGSRPRAPTAEVSRRAAGPRARGRGGRGSGPAGRCGVRLGSCPLWRGPGPPFARAAGAFPESPRPAGPGPALPELDACPALPAGGRQ